MIPGEKRQFGACNIEVDSSTRRAEPPESVMGDIARTMFYMADTYGFTLSRQDQQLFTAWSRQDPPDDWEIERNRRIKAIQGKGNRFVEDYAAIFGPAMLVETAPTPAPAAPAAPAPAVTNPSGWTCGTKTTCGQMSSCEEAKFHLTQCGVTRLDGDGDGVPCASLCRP
jgi:deoxyribonuclease-1